MEFFLSYLIVAAIYSFYFSLVFKNTNVGSFRLFMLGTTFPLHLIMLIACQFYKFFGIYLYYMVSLGEDKNEN